MLSLLLAIAQPTAVQIPVAFATLPSVERMDDARICETMRGLAREASSTQIDAASRLDRITVVCAMREISFGQAVVPADDEEPGLALAEAVCGNQAFREVAQRGWTLSTSMTAPDGSQAFRDIDCGSASGSGTASAVR